MAVGHSAGAQIISLLLGARLKDAHGNVSDEDLSDPRVKAGLLLAPTGKGDGLTEEVRKAFPDLDLDFSHMTTRALVAYGDDDDNPALTVRGAEWHAEPYHQSPGADYLLTLFGAKHFLGGIMGYDLKETDDENPELLAITQRLTFAYLRSAVDPTDNAWAEARAAFEKHTASYGRIDSKP